MSEDRLYDSTGRPLHPWLPGATLALLAVSYALSYFDRMLMVVVGEMVKSDLHLSDKELSLLTGGAFLAIYGFSIIGAGWLVDRFSRKTILLVALALWSSMTMLCGLARNFVQLACARAAVGVAEAPSLPTALSILGDTYPLAKLPLTNAVIFVGSATGSMGAFVIGAWIAQRWGWHYAFLAAGPPGFVMAMLMLLVIREPARTQHKEADLRSRGTKPDYGALWRDGALFWVMAGGSISNFIHVGMLMWLPNFFIRSHGMSLTEVGLYFGPAMTGGMACGMLAGGWIGNRLAARSIDNLLLICVGVLVAVIPLYALVLSIGSLPAALALTFGTAVVATSYAPSYNVAWQAIADPRARGVIAGVSGLGSSAIGGALCPFLVGVLSDALQPRFGQESLRYALIIGQAMCLVGALCFYLSWRAFRNDRRPGAAVAPPDVENALAAGRPA